MTDLDTEEDRVYWSFSDAVTRERQGRPVAPVDLHALYKEFSSKYFDNLVPEISDKFICVFHELPYDVSGATLIGEDALKANATAGIRINEKLKDFPSEVSVVLLHEMAHATGIRGHEEEFKVAIRQLWAKQAYLEPLIL